MPTASTPSATTINNHDDNNQRDQCPLDLHLIQQALTKGLAVGMASTGFKPMNRRLTVPQLRKAVETYHAIAKAQRAALRALGTEYADCELDVPPLQVTTGTSNLMSTSSVLLEKKVLERAGLTKDDIDIWEVNEAFAVVSEKFMRVLDLDRSKVNVNGGAMALGHPIGATGSILIGTALDELERSGGRYGLVTMCAAGGMAPAIIIERI